MSKTTPLKTFILARNANEEAKLKTQGNAPIKKKVATETKEKTANTNKAVS